MEQRPHLHDTRSSVALIIASVFLVSASDALIKLGSADFTVWQLYVVRSSIAIVLLLLWLGASRSASVWRNLACDRWILMRSTALTLMWIAFYAALPHMSLSLAALALYTAPLFIALLSALVLREKVSPSRWLAIALGFVGVLIILRPTAADFSSMTLLPVLAALLYAVAAVLTRARCGDHSALALALNLNLCLCLVGATMLLGHQLFSSPHPPLPSDFLALHWVVLGPVQWLLMGVLAVLMVLMSAGVARAYQIGPSAVVGAFDYSYLLFAMFWGFVLFKEVPDAGMALGMGLIAASGVWVMRS
ncbi:MULTISPECIES: DMT family transporter [unclassified Pseudomonas]|uniref:DMT family transporter n=1 Tax=unclassified Pseudomonas TaxID=196821 RepID=UPI0017818976|nr:MULTISPECIES: DMT family transporter [unclassified Pseudomonas]MBD8623455.1 DMT family transporter [Pseudomonas sp. CFBP 13727]MBD8826528.1 DMT family transporter [Pseudomonas sp. CFBP 13602]